MPKQEAIELSPFERARVVGARALQLSMGAPPLVKVPKGVVNAVKLAFLEFEADAIPLTVVR